MVIISMLEDMILNFNNLHWLVDEQLSLVGTEAKRKYCALCLVGIIFQFMLELPLIKAYAICIEAIGAVMENINPSK